MHYSTYGIDCLHLVAPDWLLSVLDTFICYGSLTSHVEICYTLCTVTGDPTKNKTVPKHYRNIPNMIVWKSVLDAY